MADAAAGRFEVVVVEQLGRLCPRAVDLRAVIDRLAAFGVAVHPLARASRRRLVAAGTAAAIVELAELLGG
jgi:DNA invertase Pin-like site-specific DNA recombinase